MGVDSKDVEDDLVVCGVLEKGGIQSPRLRSFMFGECGNDSSVI